MPKQASGNCQRAICGALSGAAEECLRLLDSLEASRATHLHTKPKRHYVHLSEYSGVCFTGFQFTGMLSHPKVTAVLFGPLIKRTSAICHLRHNRCEWSWWKTVIWFHANTCKGSIMARAAF
jgi:hypothetical protein